MVPRRRAVLAGCLALLVVTAGCLSGAIQSGGPSSSPSPSSTPNRSSATPSDPTGIPKRTSTLSGFREATSTPEPLAGRANCSDDLRVSFWGLNEPRLWKANQVRFVADVPANDSYLYVAYVDGTARGVKAMSGGEGGLHVDGGSVEVAEGLAGEHAVRIVVHRDVDRDQSYDPETDPPCYNDDGLVGTRHLVVDFDYYW